MSDLKKSQSLPTPARISLGPTGPSIPTREQLRFQLDHALARDAVHTQLNVTAILRSLQGGGLSAVSLRSAASDRRTYLRRPDLGRMLHPHSTETLQRHTSDNSQPSDVVFILADGLSALAVERHALPLLGAKLSALLIGERPGLSSPDSLAVYLTWEPRPGRTDAERNCISNIRVEGLGYADAAARIAYYLHEAQRLRTSGIALKDPALPLLSDGQ